MNRPVRLAILLVVYGSLSAPAYAYLDGATGSIILQGLIGGAATALVYYRMFTARAKALLARIAGRAPDETGE